MRQSPHTNTTLSKSAINATRAVVSTFGVIAALADLARGIREILQGNIAPGGMVFLSWPDSTILDGVGVPRAPVHSS
jgi:hypothetical protein